MAKRKPSDAPDALRDAVEQTFEATAGSAAETRERAAALLDQVVDRGQDALERGQEAGAAVGGQVAKALREIQQRLKP